MRIALFVGVVFLASCLSREQRGIFDDAERLWQHLNTGIDTIQVHARNDFKRLRPLAERVEEEVKPVMKQMGHAINSMADHLMKGPFFGFPDVERADVAPVVAQDHQQQEETGVDRPSSGPGLDDLLFNQFGEGSLNPFSIFGMSRRRQWWEGENVCVDRKIVEESEKEKEGRKAEEGNDDNENLPTGVTGIHSMLDMTVTSCRDGQNFHECTSHVNTNGKQKSVVVKHQCCYGFSRLNGEMGCSKIEMENMEKTIKQMNGNGFLQLIESSGLKDMLTENMTVFLPSDDAIEDLRHDLEKMNSVEHVSYNIDDGLNDRRKRSELTVVETPKLADIVKNHMVKGFMDSSLLNDEDVLDTLNDDAKVRVTVYNTYPEKVIMANCAKVMSKDHFTTNGVVHTVDKVILPATKTIADIIDSDVQFRSLAEALKKAKLMETLSQPGQFTFFAPTDEAMAKLDAKTKSKVMAGTGCSQDILKHHLLPNVICTGVIESKAKTVNSLGKYMMFERDEEDQLLIEGRKIEMRDIVATNGVIHVLEDVLIPETARSVDEALTARAAPTLQELFKLAGISEGIDAFANNTIFAPSEKALKAMPTEFMDEIKGDKKKLQDFLMYHIATPKTCKCEFQNNKLLHSGLTDRKLRVNVYDTTPFALLDASARQISTVQCARLTSLDDEICGGMIHTVDKVLLPPGGKAVEILKNSGKFTKFLELIAFAELENELSTDGPITLLAPTDDAFGHLSVDMSKKVFSDKDVAVKFVHHHTMQDVICCSGISRHVPFFDMSGHRMQSGNIVSLRRSRGGHIYAERSEITTCDMMADNGVVHALDRVLVPNALDADSNSGTPDKITKRMSPLYSFKIFK